MCSRSDPRRRAVMLVPVLTAALSLHAAALERQSGEAANADRPGDAEIARALETVRADPNLATERTIKTLKWRSTTQARRSGTPAWVAWIMGLFGWLEQSSRMLVWGAAIVLAGLTVVYVAGIVRRFRAPGREAPFVAPTHVRDLDIRPETLPQDIGAAARALWDRGEHRMALALLYRGLLSRLAHVHGIPIRDSSTEGDCLAFAASHLTQGKRDYASRVVRVWQRAVYGREDIQAGTVYVLCDDFDSALDRTPSLDAASPRSST